MYSVLKYDAADDRFTLRNPWGNAGDGYDMEFEVSIDRLWGNGQNTIFIDTQTRISPTNHPQTSSDLTQLIQSMGSFAPSFAAHQANESANMAAKDFLLAAAH